MESMEHPPQYSGSFFTPLLISLAGMSGVSIALLSYHFILVKYCIGRRSRNVTTTFHFSQMQRGRLGLEAHVLKAIPVLSFSSERNEKLLRVDQKECVICLGELEEGDKVRLLPNCGHLFHVLCIDDWFLAHSSCPICRSPIIAPESTILEVADPEPICQPQEAQNPVQCLETDHNNIRWDGNGGGCRDSCAITWQSSNASGSLRRSLSLVLPLEWDPRQFAGLKRSLSLDQSIVIDMPREIDHQKAPSCTCSSTKGIATESGSMSSRFLRSFSQMRIAPRNVPAANEVLPF